MPPLPSGQLLPIVSVRVYDEGEQDPIVVDHGFHLTDILAGPNCSARFGTFELDSSQRPKLEWQEAIGILNRPKLNFKDTLIANYSTSGGSWEQRKLPVGPQVYRLVQLDTSNAVQWSAVSSFSVPAGVDYAISLLLLEQPPDWDTATYEPYVQVEFGGSWGIQLTKQDAYLLQRIGGTYQVVETLPMPVRGQGYTDLGELIFYIREYRGCLGISSDLGESYLWYAPADGSIVATIAASITFRGQGGGCVMGLHQLEMVEGSYSPARKDTFTERPLFAPTIEARYVAPSGTSVSLADVSESARRYARYEVTLTPTTVAGTPFTFHRGASVQSVWLHWDTTIVNGAGTYTTPWDERIREISISKPPDLSQGSARILIERDRGSSWPGAVGSLRDRKIQILAGFERDGDESWWTVFTGYVTRPRTFSRGGRFFAELTLANATHTFRSTHWTSQDVRALGGQSLNDASDGILASEGLNASYRSWHALGDLLILPPGRAEEPFALLRPNECKWETLVWLNGLIGLEVAALDDATFVTVPYDYLTGNTHEYESLPEEDDLYKIAEEVSGGWDYEQAVTAILVSGTAEYGAELTAWAVDLYAETNTTSGRFAPRRHVIQEELPDTCAPGVLLSRCAALASKHFPVRCEPPISVPLNLGIGRRDEIILNGNDILGIADGTSFVVLGLQHEIRVNDDGSAQMATAGLLWEMNP